MAPLCRPERRGCCTSAAKANWAAGGRAAASPQRAAQSGLGRRRQRYSAHARRGGGPAGRRGGESAPTAAAATAATASPAPWPWHDRGRFRRWRDVTAGDGAPVTSRPQRTGQSGAVSAEGAPGCLSCGRVQSPLRLMARPEAEAEIHPLKAREAPASPGSGARDAEKEAGGGGAQPGRLSQWRTAAFFLSLYLCLGVAFAFSFVIPCPVRPASRTAWSRAYDDAGEGGWAAGALGAARGPASPTSLSLSLLQWRTPSWARGTPTGTECKTCSWPSRPAPAAGTPAAPTMALAPEEVRGGGAGGGMAGAAGVTDPPLPLRRLRHPLRLPGGAFGHQRQHSVGKTGGPGAAPNGLLGGARRLSGLPYHRESGFRRPSRPGNRYLPFELGASGRWIRFGAKRRPEGRDVKAKMHCVPSPSCHSRARQ